MKARALLVRRYIGILLVLLVAAWTWPAVAETERAEFVRISSVPGAVDVLRGIINDLGGEVVFSRDRVNYLTARVPRSLATYLQDHPLVRSMAQGEGSVTLSAERKGAYDGALHKANLSAVRADQLAEKTGSTGKGVTIAVLDTGIDPAHPDLRRTSDARRKIVDWVDLSGEGEVDTRRVGLPRSGVLTTIYGDVRVGSIQSKSGRFHYGVLRESDLDPSGYIGQDLNRNGSNRDQFFVLVVDSTYAGIYDRVYVDTNGNMDMTDETPLGPFRQTGRFGYFGKDNPATEVDERTPFVVADIAPDGSTVTLGFDGNGHGTHVAGIAAAWGEDSGMKGVAPDAQLMSIKALSSSGDGSWQRLAQAMVYAAEHGADIVSISVGGSYYDSAGIPGPEANLMEDLGREYGVLFVTAAGNTGPGLGSAFTPGDRWFSVSVGAYATPDMVYKEYSYELSYPLIWHFSAVGPRPDGSLSPELMAPGVALSTVPYWDSPVGYSVFEGTSMSVPYVAGSAALLGQLAGGVNPRAMKRAFESSAAQLPGALLLEQGHGVLDAVRAWELLGQSLQGPEIRTVLYSGDDYHEGGLYARSFLTGSKNIYIANFSPNTLRLEFANLPPWLSIDRRVMTLPAVQEGRLQVRMNPPLVPGVYSTLIRAKDRSTPGDVLRFPATAVVSHEMSHLNLWGVAVNGDLDAGRFAREFFKVPPGAREITVSLRVPRDSQGRPAGRAKLYLFSPAGRMVAHTAFVGLGADLDSQTLSITLPEAGVWEAVVESAPSLSLYNRAYTSYQLRARARGVFFDTPEVTKPLASGSSGTVEHRVTMTNYAGQLTVRLLPLGLSKSRLAEKTETLVITQREATMQNLPQVPAGTGYLRVSVGTPGDGQTDLDLYLYKYDRDFREWREVAKSAQRGRSFEVIEMLQPEPGQYVAYVEGYNMAASATTFEFSYLVATDDGSVKVTGGQRTLQEGETYTVDLNVAVPAADGTYYGAVLVWDVEGARSVGFLPLTFERGRAELALSVFPGVLEPGVINRVEITAREKDTKRSVSTTLLVNGVLYEVSNGRTYLELVGTGEEYPLVIQVYDPRYASTRHTFMLRPSSHALPAPGIFSNKTMTNLHNKMIWQTTGQTP